MKKTVLFVILEQFADWEAAYLSSALHMLGQDSFAVRTVSLKKESVESIGGFRVIPDYDVLSVPDFYTALILVGGMSWRTDAARGIAPLAEDCFRKGRILGGICDASAFLGTIGLLNDVRHTSNSIEDLKAWAGLAYTGEENYVCEQAVRDGNIITANGTAALEFAREVLTALEAAPEDKIMGWYRFHKYGCYQAPFPDM